MKASNLTTSLPLLALLLATWIDSEAVAFQSSRPISSVANRRAPISAFQTMFPFSNSKRLNQNKVDKKQTLLRGANDELVSLAYDWTVNLGAPAALVAGQFRLYTQILSC
jgi:hypothetical protein